MMMMRGWKRTLAAAWLVAAATLLGAAGGVAQEIHGFVEDIEGVRVSEGDGFERGTFTARESRVQLKVSDFSDRGEYFVRVDFPFDRFTGSGLEVELREGFFTFTGIDWMTFKFGRQISTWGTGDLLFINDVFPKDWQSFFIGRETQYLKAPTDALRFGFYSGMIDLDLVVMPQFEPDRLPTPDRLAFYNPLAGMGLPPENLVPQEPGNKVDDGEVALRAYRTIGGTELALYGFVGHWRQPLGFDPAAMRPFYPKLNVYGASARRGLVGGVFNVEGGYLDSREDRCGDKPNVENSSARFMLGYDRQLWTDFQLGAQGYYEWMQDHEKYKEGLDPGAFVRDEWRQLYTLRLTQFLKYQTVKLSLFTYWSPTDEDYYVRASGSYKLSDPIEIMLGANVFGGTNRETLFGQLDANDNIYFRGRYSF